MDALLILGEYVQYLFCAKRVRVLKLYLDHTRRVMNSVGGDGFRSKHRLFPYLVGVCAYSSVVGGTG